MSRKWIALCVLAFALAFLLLLQAAPAYAQEAAPENDANCVACHEHRYYLHDEGKWYCLCEAPMHCVYCHGGRTDSTVEEVAHEGLVLYPTRDQAIRCQTCHEEDYMSRVVTFSTAAGVSSTPLPIATATQSEPIAAKLEGSTNSPVLRLGQLEPWRLISLGLLAIGLVGIAIMAYRCWKADCLFKSQNKSKSLTESNSSLSKESS